MTNAIHHSPQLAQDSSLFAPGFVELRHGEFIPFQNPLRLEMEPYGYRFYQIVPAG